ncbi:DUF1738 domain-containing protein [Pseudomonas aeruginosa]|nr:DUF1738 domain-containing protein [Pseudomonas aeruginosa]
MNEIDLTKIEQETRYLVDLVNQNPTAFAKNAAGIPALPLEISILAQNFASDKDLSAVKAYEHWLSVSPKEIWQKVAFNGSTGSDYADYIPEADLQGLTPNNVHRGFLDATSKHAGKIPNLIELNHQYMALRKIQTEFNLSEDFPMDDYQNIHIANTERFIQARLVYVVEDVENLNRPKTDLELELDAIREEFSSEHSDIKIDVGQYEKIEAKQRKRFFAGKDEKLKTKIESDLTSSLQRLIDRLDNPEISPAKKWITATFPFQAYNVVSNYSYNAENSTFAEMYCEEFGYETGCFISAKEALSRGFTKKEGEGQHFFVNRFPVDIPAWEMKDGEKVPKLKEDGSQETYRIYTIGYSMMLNIDQLDWLDDSKPDPRIKWKEKYKKGIEKEPCNQEKLEAFKAALLELNYVDVKFGQAVNAYVPSEDSILMKNENQFRNSLRFCHTFLHELAHSTGHKDRHARQTLYDYHVDVAFRGQEELIANRVAALLIQEYGLHESELKDSYEANNEVYDLGWARKAYEKDPMLIMDTIGSAQYAFKELKDKIDSQLKLMNNYELFNKKEVEFEKPEPKKEYSNDYKSKSKSTYKRRMPA